MSNSPYCVFQEGLGCGHQSRKCRGDLRKSKKRRSRSNSVSIKPLRRDLSKSRMCDSLSVMNLSDSISDWRFTKSQESLAYKNLFDQIEETKKPTEEWNRYYKLYTDLPDHDRRILDRMAMKRNEEIVRSENATIARKHWDVETERRSRIIAEQNQHFKNAVMKKRYLDHQLVNLRQKEIHERKNYELDQLKKYLEHKDLRVMCRLQELQLARELALCRQKHENCRKQHETIANYAEHELDEKLRKQQMFHRLEQKLQEAQCNREHFISAYRHRLRNDYETFKDIQEANLEVVKSFERHKMHELKQKLRAKDARLETFLHQKRTCNDQIKKKAEASAILREFVRVSLTPDICSRYSQ